MTNIVSSLFGIMIAASQLVVYIASQIQTLSNDITEIKSAKELIRSLQHDIEYIDRAKAAPVELPP